VFVGVSDTSLGLTLELVDQSYAAGAAAVVAAPPYYLPMSQADLLAYMTTLADRSSLPLLLYNMPSCTKTALAVETVGELRKHDNIIGLKDSSGNLDYFRAVARMLDGDAEFTLLIGPEELLVESMELGGRGGVTGGANLFPRFYVAMYEAAADGRWEQAHELQQVVRRMSSMIYQLGDSGARVIQGIKMGLEVLGICESRLSSPFRGHGDHERAIVVEALSEIEPPVERLCPGPQSAR
jgi:4-hydroxy-tetrahydrodipicolinate synthase